MSTERTTIDISELNENQRRYFYFEKYFPDLLIDINIYNNEYNIKNFSILLYHYHHKINHIVKCKICGVESKFISFNKGYNKYCSRKCSMNDKEVITKRNKKSVETNLEKYGVSNPMKNGRIKEKVKKSNLEKYGATFYTKTDEYKNRIIKNNLEKYGVEWYQQTDEFKSKSAKSNLEKYGFNHHMKNKRFIKSLKEKNIIKWGVDNFSKTSEFKELMHNYYISDSFNNNVQLQRERKKEKEKIYYENYNIKYKLININYDILEYNCQDCNNTFSISKQLFYLRNKNNHTCCTICNETNSKNISYLEKEVLSYIKSIYDKEIVENYKSKYEIDIYLPDLKLGFEFNGLYWHSELFKDKSYHQNKSFHFKDLDIHIFNIWEDDWVYKKNIIKSMILYKIDKCTRKLYARKTEIREIKSNKIVEAFLNENHLQGYSTSSIKIGLFHNDELVSLMTFGRSKNKKNETEMIRFCNKLNISVIGGFSKILNYYIHNYNYEKIISYADISHSMGDLYLKNSFILEKITEVGYYWCNNGKKYNRFNFRKSKLVSEGNNPNETENDIMRKMRYYKLYNCGNYKFYIENIIKIKK
jgi:hypothetical protein